MFRSLTVDPGFRLHQVGTVPFCSVSLDIGIFFEAKPDKFGTYMNWRGGPVCVVIYAERPFEAGNRWEKVALASTPLPPYARSDYERRRFPPYDRMTEAQLAGLGRWWTGAHWGIQRELPLDTALWPGKYRLAAVIARSYQDETDHALSYDASKRVMSGYVSGIVEMPLGLFENGRVHPLNGQAGVIVPVGEEVKKGKPNAFWVPEIFEPDLPSFKRHYLRLGNTSLARARHTGQTLNPGTDRETVVHSVRLGTGNNSQAWNCRMDFGHHPLICVDAARAFPVGAQPPTAGLKFGIGRELRNSIRHLIGLADETPVASSPFAPAYTTGLIAGAGREHQKHVKAMEVSIAKSRDAILDGKRALDSDWGPQQVAVALKVAVMTPGRIAIIRDPNNSWMKSYAARFLFDYCSLSLTHGFADSSEQLLLCLDLAVHAALQLRTIERILGDQQDTPHKVAARFSGTTYFNKDVVANLGTVFFAFQVYDLFKYEFPNLEAIQ